jgi:demethylmenaquinone methyltransferase/2-methoxy-6-polyprenyl-1,4-benzoquinol methylase
MVAMAPALPRRGHSPPTRTKRSLDLSRPEALESLGEDQIAYYRARAPWYDDVYDCTGDYDRGPELNAQWLADLAEVRNALSAVPLHGQCVELGAGTGYWTELVIDRVERLWALDTAPEVQRIAQARLGAKAPKVQFELVNLWRWEPAQVWDSAVAFFFLEHVPDEVLPRLARRASRRFAPRCTVLRGRGSGPRPRTPDRDAQHRRSDL